MQEVNLRKENNMPPRIPTSKEFSETAEWAQEVQRRQERYLAQQEIKETRINRHHEMHRMALATFEESPVVPQEPPDDKLIECKEEAKNPGHDPKYAITRRTPWKTQSPEEHEGEEYIIGFRCVQYRGGCDKKESKKLIPKNWEESAVGLEMQIKHKATGAVKVYTIADIWPETIIYYEEGFQSHPIRIQNQEPVGVITESHAYELNVLDDKNREELQAIHDTLEFILE